ncbi:MAG: adenylate/guanylate cyclase domain-containing protein, partial [Gemmatimonadota bacterium]
EVVMRYDASVYQYVGDEVVLTWPWGGAGRRERESVHAFFAFRSLLDANRSAYESRFGAMPEFRGGIDLGPVTVIEVGDVKREIVYHGDVLNTAARLLELCKRRGDGLVVSRTVGEAVEDDRALQATWREPVSLRGKREPVDACGLQAVGPVH